MPPKVRFKESDIITYAIEIIREEGIEALNSRYLAEKMGCSVQPLFYVFSSMDELKKKAISEIWNFYNNKILEVIQNGIESFLNVGMVYIRFAKEEQNFFRLLFMSDEFRDKDVMNIMGSEDGGDEITKILMNETKMDIKQTQELYAGLWFITHGIASLVATNNCIITEKEINEMLSRAFVGLIYAIKNET